jgi:putative transposase
MPRAARVVIPGCPHHVVQRGNNRQDVFFVDSDREYYLEVLRDQSCKFGLRVEGYCLMTNHLHIVATPDGADSLAKAVGRTNLYYTRYINRLHGRRGHLWQDRFFSSPLDEEHFWNALIYVERNPVRAKRVRKPWRWPWSSAAAHVSGSDPTGLLDLSAWAQRLPRGSDWREAIGRPQDELIVERLRLWSHRGCPLGSDRFISKLESLLNRRLRPRPRGRPSKKNKRVKNGNRPE